MVVVEGFEGGRQSACFEFVRQSWMHRRAKLNVSSEPALVGIWYAVPRVGQGARDAAERGQRGFAMFRFDPTVGELR